MVITGILGVMGLTWTVFWSIIQAAKREFNDKVDSFKLDFNTDIANYENIFRANIRDIDSRMNKMVEERVKLMEESNHNIAIIRENLKDKPDYKYLDDTFQRKDITMLQFQVIENALKAMEAKIDNIVKMIKNGV